MMSAPERARTKSLMAFTGFLTLTLFTGAIGGFATSSSVEGWYQTLQRPAFTPPDATFGIVWTALYALIAIAAWRVWSVGWDKNVKGALVFWYVQLGLNLLWSFLFFYWQQIGAALIEIVVLLVAIAWTQRAFLKVDRFAGWLLAPYIIWVAFATVLNGGFWLLNS